MDGAIRSNRLTTKGVEGGGITVHTENQVMHGEDGRSVGRGNAELRRDAVGMR